MIVLALENYSVDEVKKLLKKLKLKEYRKLVDVNGINGKLLSAANKPKHLTEMGFKNRLAAQKLLKRIKKIKSMSKTYALYIYIYDNTSMIAIYHIYDNAIYDLYDNISTIDITYMMMIL